MTLNDLLTDKGIEPGGYSCFAIVRPNRNSTKCCHG